METRKIVVPRLLLVYEPKHDLLCQRVASAEDRRSVSVELVSPSTAGALHSLTELIGAALIYRSGRAIDYVSCRPAQ